MKTILITGANRGIGFETARQLATRGFHVVIGARSQQHGGKAVRELARLGNASLLVIDVSDSKSVASAASEFSSIDHLDVLINNAGIYPDEGMSEVRAGCSGLYCPCLLRPASAGPGAPETLARRRSVDRRSDAKVNHHVSPTAFLIASSNA